jgi:hypothetical protein
MNPKKNSNAARSRFTLLQQLSSYDPLSHMNCDDTLPPLGEKMTRKGGNGSERVSHQKVLFLVFCNVPQVGQPTVGTVNGILRNNLPKECILLLIDPLPLQIGRECPI